MAELCRFSSMTRLGVPRILMLWSPAVASVPAVLSAMCGLCALRFLLLLVLHLHRASWVLSLINHHHHHHYHHLATELVLQTTTANT